jgi:NAD(P)-dependent dehydrogenase (short-subunit alcohol dehydrogenase family)
MSKSDRVWFITGASSGFGRALAEAVISRGERAVVAARRGAARRWRN